MNDHPLPSEPRGFRAELVAMVRLALPIVVVQLGQMTMGVVDTVMIGRVSAVALAAIALGNLYVFGAVMFGWGVLFGLDPVVAQAVGAGDSVAMQRGVQRGLVLAVGLSLLAALLLAPARPVMGLLGQPAGVADLAATYALISIPGILPFYGFTALRQSLQAMRRIAPIVWTSIAANLVNIGLNYVFVFGKAGAPAMGVAGSSLATSISRWFMMLLLLVVSWRDLRPYLVPLRPDTFAWGPLWRMVTLGAPIGAQFQLEYGVFAVVGLMMGWLGTIELAGHQVALNLASLTFMVPMGVASAAAVLVGHAAGRGDAAEARRAAAAALVCGVGFMSVSAVFMLTAPHFLARVYTTDAQVLAMAATLIPIAGVFQVFDGTQVVSIGILRGVADTRTPMIMNVLGYWLVGLPISAILGFSMGKGPSGLWWGLVVGLVLVAVVLVLRVRSRLARDIGRVLIDRESVLT